MKKLITLVLALCLVLTSFAGVSADSVGLFKGMNVLSDLTGKADTDLVTRQEFASVAATLMGVTAEGTAETIFTDVAEDNVYGAAIRAVYGSGVMNGVSNSEFAPTSTITLRDAAVVLIRILGYEPWAVSKGGYPQGYLQAATSLKLFNKVSGQIDSPLTFGDLWKMTDWALETNTPESIYSMQDGTLSEEIKISKNAPTLLEKNLGLTVYEAEVMEIEGDTHSLRVVITDTEIRDDSKHQLGDSIVFKASPTVNIVKFDKAPVEVWVTDDDKLVYIDVQVDCEVKYGTVYSVNRDYRIGQGYNTASINEITLLDEKTEYKRGDTAVKFYKNGNLVTGNIELNDKYVRMITKNDEILVVETWDFRPGGLVTASSFKSISFARGDATEGFKNLEDYKNQILIVDGEVRDMKDLKVGTLVDYYLSSDNELLVILASEKKYSDILDSYANDEIQIGNLCIKADTNNLYLNAGGEGYKKVNVSALGEIMGEVVSAYVDATGKVRFVTTEGIAEKSEFIGYLKGFNAGLGRLVVNKEMLIVNLQDLTFPEKVYPVSKNVKYYAKRMVSGAPVRDSNGDVVYDEITEAAVAARQDMYRTRHEVLQSPDSYNMTEDEALQSDVHNDSIFLFKVNAKGEIISVTEPEPYFGFNTSGSGYVSSFWTTTGNQFAQRGDHTFLPNVLGNASDRFIYFHAKNNPIVVIYDRDGETEFTKTDYNTLSAKITDKKTLFTYYGKAYSSDYDLIIATEGAGELRLSSGGSASGILTSIRVTEDEEGNTQYVAVINGNKFIINKNDANTTALLNEPNRPENTLVKYKTVLNKETVDYDITITSITYLRGDMFDWVEADPATFLVGTVKKIDSKRVYFEDGAAEFFPSGGAKFRKYESERGTMTDGNANDFLEGRTVVYTVTRTNSASTVNEIFYQD